MVEHHLVGFAADAGLLLSAEGRVGGIQVVAVGPDATGLDAPGQSLHLVNVPGPDAGAQSVHGVVGDLQGFFLVLEGGHAEHRTEDLFLEHTHVVLALEHRGLDVIALGIGLVVVGFAAAENLGPFILADLDVVEDLHELVVGCLGAHHGGGVQGVAHLDGVDTLQAALHELVVDVLLDQRPGRTGADLALIEGEQHQALDGFVQEVVVGGHDGVEEDVGRFSPQFQGHRDDVLGSVLHDEAAGGGFPGESHLADIRVGG